METYILEITIKDESRGQAQYIIEEAINNADLVDTNNAYVFQARELE